MALTSLGNEQGYLKAAFFGFPKSGKTFTSARLAIGVRKAFNLPGPIAMFDTETGSNYIAEMVKQETGMDLLGVRARSFKELMQFGKDCLEAEVSVAIVDSISHPWRELTDSYLEQLNEARRARQWSAVSKLEFQHWAAVKKLWEPWPNFFLNSKLHIILCGRAGFTWDMEKQEEGGKRELVKTGTKMRVESEFSFEPSLLVEMEMEDMKDERGVDRIVHKATIVGDRFGKIDGAIEVNPDYKFFEPHVMMLKPGSHAPVNTDNRTQTGVDVDGSGDWAREQKARTILCEEIQGAIVSVFPGQSAEEKKKKADLLHRVFGTRSWTAVESMNSTRLRECLATLKVELGISDPPPVATLPSAEPAKPQEAPTA